MHELTFGFSPCPNDTFAFHAVVHELVGADLRVQPSLRDIEDLNRAARSSELALTKLSVGALAGLGDRYRPLRAGAALGHGVGPLVVAREPATLADAVAGRFAVPGLDTTAFLLLRLAAPELGEIVELRYDRILEAVATGQVDAGLIIHESRFTYEEHGLVRVADLGEWWEARDRPAGAARGDRRASRPRSRASSRQPSRRCAPRSSTRSRTRRRAGTTCEPTRRSSPTRSATVTSRCTSTSSASTSATRACARYSHWRARVDRQPS